MARSTRPKIKSAAQTEPILTAKNYQLFGLAIFLLAVAYGGMYIENEFLGTFALYVAPILLVIGYVTVAFAIMKRFPKDKVAE